MEITNIAYVVGAVCFILGIKMLSHPRTARKGNGIASLGMLIAIVATLTAGEVLDFKMIGIAILIGSIIGGIIAQKIEMTQMPQMVAIFNGLGGGASALVASAEFFSQYNQEPTTFLLVTIILSVFIGTLTLTGSFIAFGKLQGFISGKPIVFPAQQLFNALVLISIFTLGYFILGSTPCISYFRYYPYYSDWGCRYASSNFITEFLFWYCSGRYGIRSHEQCFDY